MFDNEGNFYNVAYGIDTTWSFVSVDMFEELGISAAASDAEFLENCRVAEEVGLVGALAKRDREEIGKTSGPDRHSLLRQPGRPLYQAHWVRHAVGTRRREPLTRGNTMHTSSRLRSSHFQYRRIDAGAHTHVGFSAFCADYHEQDRVGVVSPRLEDGVLHAGYALLALTTAFFDAQRSRGGDFFVYPQHFAIIGADQSGVATGAGRLNLTLDDAGFGGAWGWLDVWPNSNWTTAPNMAAAMLGKVFDFQINRLFWPQNFMPGDKPLEDLLPAYARRILESRLKSVYYYNSPAPTVEIIGAQPAVKIVRESIERLPAAVRSSLSPHTHPRPEPFRQVSADAFVHDMQRCFAD